MNHCLKILFVSLLFMNTTVFAKCDALVINKAKTADWTLTIPDTNCNPCVIQHGTIKEIHYPDHAEGELQLSDPTGKMKSYQYSNEKEDMSGIYHAFIGCPYIKHRHEPNTGGASLNEPDMGNEFGIGSIMIEKESW